MEAVHAHPDGEATVARMALTASEYGFDGIVVRNHGDSPASYDPERIREAYGIDVATGVEIRAEDPSRASGFVGNHREDVTLVAVHGGDPGINRFAVGQPAVDVLAHPTRGEGEFDHVHAREAADNGVRIELSLRPLLIEAGGTRVRAIADLRRLADLIEQYDTPYVVSVDPRSHLGLRAPRDLAALGEAVGVPEGWVEAGLAEWGRLVQRNRTLHERGVERGVWVEPEDECDCGDGDGTGD
jgi:ribonuclease P/MRP protein subunit RPP1